MTTAQDILGGRAAVLLALLDGPARATTLHDRIRERMRGCIANVTVTDGACRKALACLERDGLATRLLICSKAVGYELTPAGRAEANLLRAACLALATPMPAVKLATEAA